VNQVTDRDVRLTGVYQGRRRMTLTFPAITRTRRVLRLLTGAEKAEMLARLRKADASIPAGRVRRDRAVIGVIVRLSRERERGIGRRQSIPYFTIK